MEKRDRKREAHELCLRIGKKIRDIRKTKKLTVAEVAYRAGVEPQNFRKYELGKQEMRISMLMRIAEALELKMKDLID
ncbi:helix-turn-helix domain-containing protein [Aquimarina algiphila]|uniref:helix-turn-helix domain-containing protein n=1 Tax=Aquimarina algiphila TaxID=2047982 RepID=UPI00232D8E55|nr:helix-turn-helix transcriptional regulator [Aquimarina algiphila]